MKHKFIHTVTLVLASFAGLMQSRSQALRIDSLEKLLKLEKNDSVRIELLTQLSKNYDNVDTGKARFYYRQADSIAERSGNDIYKGFVAEIAGVLYTRYDQKKALQHYNDAVRLLSKPPQSFRVKGTIASLNNNLGVIHYFNGDLEGALRFFMEAVKFYEENDPRNLNCGYGYGNISTTYADLKKIENAAIYSRKAVDFAERSKNKNIRMSAAISHASTLIKLKQYDAFRPFLEEAKKIAIELKNNYNLYLYYYNFATYHYDIAEYQQALDHLLKALEYARAMNSPNEIGSMLNSIGTCYLRLSEYEKAHKMLKEAGEIGIKNNLKNITQENYAALSELYETTGDFQSALLYKKRATDMKDSTYSEENIKRIEFLDAQYQGEKKEKEILALQQQKQVQAFAIRQKGTLNFILAGAVIALLITGFLLYKNIRHRQQLARQQDALQRQRISELEKDKQLAAVDAMLKGQEDERNRLAKDLHDGLGGLLSGVKFSLSNMKDNLIITPENMAVFERSLDMLDTSIRELRRVAHNMMPEMLTRFGLDEALKEYANSVNATKLVALKYQSIGMESRLDQSAEIIIYRIIQELVNNILKHAMATEAFIQLVKENSRLNIVVEDNGKGFDTAILDTIKGAGWVNIRSRVEYLKGQLDVHAEPGRGTLVNIELNL